MEASAGVEPATEGQSCGPALAGRWTPHSSPAMRRKLGLPPCLPSRLPQASISFKSRNSFGKVTGGNVWASELGRAGVL